MPVFFLGVYWRNKPKCVNRLIGKPAPRCLAALPGPLVVLGSAGICLTCSDASALKQAGNRPRESHHHSWSQADPGHKVAGRRLPWATALLAPGHVCLLLCPRATPHALSLLAAARPGADTQECNFKHMKAKRAITKGLIKAESFASPLPCFPPTVPPAHPAAQAPRSTMNYFILKRSESLT